MLHFSELLLPSENSGLLKCYNGVIKVIPLSSGCQCGQSTHPPLRFNISLAKKHIHKPKVTFRCNYVSCMRSNHTTNFRLWHFLLVTGRQECVTCSPRSLRAESSLHIRVSAFATDMAAVVPLVVPCMAAQRARPSDPLHVCGGSALHLTAAKPQLTHRLVGIASKPVLIPSIHIWPTRRTAMSSGCICGSTCLNWV